MNIKDLKPTQKAAVTKDYIIECDLDKVFSKLDFDRCIEVIKAAEKRIAKAGQEDSLKQDRIIQAAEEMKRKIANRRA